MKKTITGILIVLLALTSIMPAVGSSGLDDGSLAAVMECQSNILTYASLSVLPLKIITTLMNEGGSWPSRHPAPASKQSRKHAAASSDHITLSDSKVKTSLKTAFRYPLTLSASVQVIVREGAGRDNCGGNSCPVWCLIPILMFMLQNLLLPRGSLDDSLMRMFSAFKDPARTVPDRVFLLTEAIL